MSTMVDTAAEPASADSKDPVSKPQNWEIVVSVAYLRLTGRTQVQAAEEAGCSERSVIDWEKCSWWPIAEAEAHQRWLRGRDAQVRDALDRAMRDPEEYAATARWWADRRIPELAPPKVRQEHDVTEGFADLLKKARERSGGSL